MEVLGFPPAWMPAGECVPFEQRLRILREHFDGLDIAAIQRLARWKPKPPRYAKNASAALSEKLAGSLVKQIELRRDDRAR